MKLRRSIFILTFILILVVSTVLGKSLITVTKSAKEVVVLTRFEEYHFDAKTGNLNSVFILTEKRVQIFEHDNDGFDLTVEGTTLKVVEDPIIYGENLEGTGFDKFVKVTFNYGFAKKTYIIENDPNYTFYVEIETSTPCKVTLPRVWFPETDRFIKGFFISFAPKGKFISIVEHNKGLTVENVINVDGKMKMLVFMGPSKHTLLRQAFPSAYNDLMETLRRVKGFTSWYDPLFYGLVWFFWWLYSITKNFGWAIIIFTVVVRLILYPLYHAQTKSLMKMRKIQPLIEQIRKKYKDPTKQQEALMKLYKESGVNPASGCLMLLVQLPIFFMLWAVIRYFVEEFAYGSRFLLWEDLSIGGFKENIILVVTTIVASYFTTLITSQDVRSAWQGIIMSVIFPFLFIGLPTGLFLYYTTNTLIQLVVTYYIYKRYKIKGITTRELFGLPSPRG